MNDAPITIFRRFTLLIFIIVMVMGSFFLLISYFATTYYHEASTQLLNKDVAWHIAKFTSPFANKAIDRQKADSVFQDAMVLSPAAEVYFLDSLGKVIYYHAADNEIITKNVGLNSITQYLNAKGEKFIKGMDPRDPEHNKIFSAAEVKNGNNILGYIYVILDSKVSENTLSMLFGSHVLRLALQAFLAVIILTLIFSLIYIKSKSRNYSAMIKVLERFESGDFSARIDTNGQAELLPVIHAFNKMATLISGNMYSLKRSVEERKNFLASISHDLRTPLSIARGYIETLILAGEKEQSSFNTREQYVLIQNKILQLSGMVNQLFELSKMEASSFQAMMEPMVLSEIVYETVNAFQQRAAEKNIKLNCIGCSGHTWIKADVAMVERILQNLADNAIKNTASGDTITLEIQKSENYVTLIIRNPGNPVPVEILSWIKNFDAVEPISKRPHHNGLGLTIVQKMLQLQGTFLHAEIIGHQNVFSFSFPEHLP